MLVLDLEVQELVLDLGVQEPVGLVDLQDQVDLGYQVLSAGLDLAQEDLQHQSEVRTSNT